MKLNSFIQNLGFTKQEASVYVALVKHGQQTIMQLSRKTSIARTTLYRLLEQMKEGGLVESVVVEHSSMYKAVEIDKLKLLLKKKEADLQKLQTMFPAVVAAFPQTSKLAQADTKVLFYKGRSGIQQMVWNVLSAKTEVLGYTYRRIEEAVGVQFTKDWSEEFVTRGLKGRDVYSDTYVASLKKRPEELRKQFGYMKRWKSRFVKPNVLAIDHQLDMYDSVTAFYSWFEEDVFGVEIHNKKVTRLQKQLFELVWEKGE